MSKSAASFLIEFLRHPTQTGAILPSSQHLAEAMVEWLDLGEAHAVLEYGPGTGPFTPHILRRIGKECRFVAIERNGALAEEFRYRFPGVTLIEDSVENVRAICDGQGIESVDCIVCGLPWAAFSDELQTRLLDAMMSVLSPGGQFVTFAGASFGDKYLAHQGAERAFWMLYSLARPPESGGQRGLRPRAGRFLREIQRELWGTPSRAIFDRAVPLTQGDRIVICRKHRSDCFGNQCQPGEPGKYEVLS